MECSQSGKLAETKLGTEETLRRTWSRRKLVQVEMVAFINTKSREPNVRSMLVTDKCEINIVCRSASEGLRISKCWCMIFMLIVTFADAFVVGDVMIFVRWSEEWWRNRILIANLCNGVAAGVTYVNRWMFFFLCTVFEYMGLYEWD